MDRWRCTFRGFRRKRASFEEWNRFLTLAGFSLSLCKPLHLVRQSPRKFLQNPPTSLVPPNFSRSSVFPTCSLLPVPLLCLTIYISIPPPFPQLFSKSLGLPPFLQSLADFPSINFVRARKKSARGEIHLCVSMAVRPEMGDGASGRRRKREQSRPRVATPGRDRSTSKPGRYPPTPLLTPALGPERYKGTAPSS